jgi:hypothetical protein
LELLSQLDVLSPLTYSIHSLHLDHNAHTQANNKPSLLVKRSNKNFSNDDDNQQHHRAPTAAIRIARALAIALLVTILLVVLVPLRKGIHNIDTSSILINNAVPNQRQDQEEVHTTTIHTEDEGNSNNSHEEKWMKKAKIEQLNQRQILFFVPEHISMIEPWLQRK